MTWPIEFHRLAIAEARKARLWYAKRSPLVAARFMEKLTQAVADIAEAPLRYASFTRGTRFVLLGRFPYLVIYRLRESSVEIIAVAHGKRRSGYWRRRLKR